MKKIFLMLTILFLIPNIVHAQSGCCSHHGGVSGCSESGRQICNDGSLSPSCTCTPSVRYIYGCTDSNAKNYNSSANKDDGSCLYYKYGCTNSDSINYDSTAEKDDGSCIPIVYGCMDSDAENYNVDANKDDGSCKYSTDDEVESNDASDSDDSNKKETSKKEESSDVGGTLLGFGMFGTIMFGILKKTGLC